MADETPTIKFAQWRPIGVCDNGPPNQRKAQLFSKLDFAIVTAPGVTRENWRQHPEVLKLIRRYAQDFHFSAGIRRPAGWLRLYYVISV